MNDEARSPSDFVIRNSGFFHHSGLVIRASLVILVWPFGSPSSGAPRDHHRLVIRRIVLPLPLDHRAADAPRDLGWFGAAALVEDLDDALDAELLAGGVVGFEDAVAQHVPRPAALDAQGRRRVA